MIRGFIINKYLAREFIKVIIVMSLIFFCLGIVMNIFEEINFFKDIDIGVYLPITLSLLYVPSYSTICFHLLFFYLVFGFS